MRRIDPIAAGERIVAASAVQQVVAVAAIQNVVSGVAGQHVIARPASYVLDQAERIIACPTGSLAGGDRQIDSDCRGRPDIRGGIRPRTTNQYIIATAADERVIAGCAVQNVVGSVACQRVIAGTSDQVLDRGKRIGTRPMRRGLPAAGRPSRKSSQSSRRADVSASIFTAQSTWKRVEPG